MDYIKLALALIASIVIAWVWRSYDYITIPSGNMQMSPSFNEKESYLGESLQDSESLEYGDVVYYSFPINTKKIKGIFFARIIGMPGDRIRLEKGNVYRNDELLDETYLSSDQKSEGDFPEILVPSHHVYLLVDKRKFTRTLHERDSRHWGPLLITSLRGVISN